MPNILKPQEGFQRKFLSCKADICIGGSAAGVGKTWALLADPLRYINTIKGFGGTLFRRTTKQVHRVGGLWDNSAKLYPIAGLEPKLSTSSWVAKNGNRITFDHIEHETNVYDYQGTEIPFIGFDELTHFTDAMFWYMVSRNRSTCGVKPWIRATCNPDPDSWVAHLIQWFIDSDGYVDKSKEGVLRYFVRYGGDFIWGDTYNEVIDKADFFLDEMIEKSKGTVTYENLIKSLTVIGGSIYDNKELLSKDPSYLGGLLTQSEEEQMRLLHGNWKVRIDENDIYNYNDFLGVFDNVRDVQKSGKYITADIALKGSNKLVIFVWEGFEIIDCVIMSRSDGKQVIDNIVNLCKKHGVNNNNICYDADGVGGYVDGFIRGSIPFNGGLPAMGIKDDVSGKRFKEFYFNLKTQCYYRSGDRVSRGEIKVSDHVASMMYDESMTIRQRFIHERKAIKRDKVDHDGKLRIIGKDEMKIKLNGQSPDLMDALMMRELFELKPKKVFLYVDN